MTTIKTIIVVAALGVFALVGMTMISQKDSPAAPSLGALAGPDIPFNWLRWGGIATYQGSASLKTATTTVCAIQSPAATSTLVHAAVRVDTSSTTATTWDVAKASTAFATTTAISAAQAVAGSAQAFIHASSTDGSLIFGPNQYLVVGVRAGISAGDAAGTGFVPSGACQATFVAL